MSSLPELSKYWLIENTKREGHESTSIHVHTAEAQDPLELIQCDKVWDCNKLSSSEVDKYIEEIK